MHAPLGKHFFKNILFFETNLSMFEQYPRQKYSAIKDAVYVIPLFEFTKKYSSEDTNEQRNRSSVKKQCQHDSTNKHLYFVVSRSFCLLIHSLSLLANVPTFTSDACAILFPSF